jgi:glycosyltransferase involved in cell wall biosynthesis
MKILHLLYESEGDYFGTGGVCARAYKIYRYLSERHDITLLCKKYPGARDGFKKSLKHIFVGAESKSLTKTLLSYAYHSAQFIKKYGNEFDLVIEEFSPAIPTFLHFVRKKPLILQVQGYTGLHYFRKYDPARAFVLRVMEHLRPRFYNNFIVINEETVKKLSLDNRKKIEIIPNGVSAAFLGISSHNGEYVLYLGRIDIYGKSLDILLSAYQEFNKSFPDIKLVVAGDGKDMEEFKSMIMKLPEKVSRNIVLLGWIVIFPSRHEVQPLGILEAMACGKPIIVSKIPELRFVTEKRAGISFETGDAVSLSQSMKNLMTSDTRKEMGQRGRLYAKNVTWDRIAMQYEAFLYKIAGKSTE